MVPLHSLSVGFAMQTSQPLPKTHTQGKHIHSFSAQQLILADPKTSLTLNIGIKSAHPLSFECFCVDEHILLVVNHMICSLLYLPVRCTLAPCFDDHQQQIVLTQRRQTNGHRHCIQRVRKTISSTQHTLHTHTHTRMCTTHTHAQIWNSIPYNISIDSVPLDTG